MLRTKTAYRIVCIAAVFMLAASVCLWGVVESVQGDGSHEIGYESLLFDRSRVHTIEITMDNWDGFIAGAMSEEYSACNIVIDGENLGEVAIRAKGNTSLSSVASLNSTRYSFKVEFDQYTKGKTYHGLDKLSLNNLIQDATMMKDYLAYTLMAQMDVPSSLCSYTQVIVNGEVWGLYLAVEGVEDSFLERNGLTRGELYKPDSMSFGGGRGNGEGFDMEQFRETEGSSGDTGTDSSSVAVPEGLQGFDPSSNPFGGSFSPPEGTPEMPEGGFSFPGGSFGGSTEGGDSSSGESGNFPQQPGGDFGGGFGGFNFGMGSDDVRLVYTDDNEDSYSNIFNNAKTNISSRGKTRLISSLKKLNEGEGLDSVVNKDEVIRYLAVHNFLCNDDSYTGMMVHNYYLYEEKGRLSIIPWDYNLAFGGFSASEDATSTVNSPIDSPVTGGTTDSRPLIAWIFSDEESLAAYHEAYSLFISECVESGWLEEEITRVKEMITPYVESDPSAFYTAEEFETAVSTLQAFCAKRAESVRGQLDGAIPSTSQGQKENSDALISAAEISTADMGSMNTGNNQGGGGMSPPGNFGPSGSQGGGFTPPEGMNPSDLQGNGSFTPPEGFNPSDSQGSGNLASPSVTQPETGTDTQAVAGASDSPDVQSAAEPSSEPAVPESRDRASHAEGFAPGGDFSGRPDSAGQWLQAALYAALLLAAILVVCKVRGHNS